MTLFNHKVFSFRTFNAFTPRQARAQRIAEFIVKLQKLTNPEDRRKLRSQYSDCLVEVKEYSNVNSSWESQNRNDPKIPKYMTKKGEK